jgi:hypothetical protein
MKEKVEEIVSKMKSWPKNPVIYEINTWVWLQELSQTYKEHLTLANVPAKVWDSIENLGIDAVWLMGVWERSPKGIEIVNHNLGIQEEFRSALSDFESKDNVGSPFCIRQYVVDKCLGGPEGLAHARKELSRREIRLILDFVPNHVAPDHPWIILHPEFFIQGTANDAKNDPASFIEMEGRVFARGRDPFFPSWPDVLQLNAFNRGLRNTAIETLSDIAGQCDGVRCDMAMLLINSVFERTWDWRAGQRPLKEFWKVVIPKVKGKYPDFLFIAEAYWDLEWELQQQGFDYCYDKRFYDLLEKDTAENILLHLCADINYQEKLVRFIENHDETRAGVVFPSQKERASAIIISTIPGAKLFHEGQFEGRKVKIPVFLGRRPVEPVDPELQLFYRTLLKSTSRDIFRNGHWQLVDGSGWPDNPSYHNILTWCWHGDGEYHLIVVNFSDSDAQALIRLPWDEFKGKTWYMTDLFTGTEYERNGDEMVNNGLYIDLPPWGYHFMTRIKEV